MDKLIAMQVFVKVVETGGFASAGRAMGFSPASVTRRVRELEDQLGVTLLHRTTRKLSLTEAGESYYEQSREIVQAVDEADLAVTERRSAPKGTLRITVATGIARIHIAPAVAIFLNQYPKVRIVLKVTDRPVDIVGEGVDIAIRTGQLTDSSLMARKIGEARRMVCASPAYIKQAGMPVHPTDLEKHSCITYRAHPGSNIWEFGTGRDVVSVPVTGPFFSDDGETLVTAACSDLGFIFVPEWLTGGAIASGALQEVLTDFSANPAVTPLHAVYTQGPYTAPNVRAFIDFLTDRFLKGYSWSKLD